jgi:Holliday junction resolvasome RuvABC endonuclease subunit
MRVLGLDLSLTSTGVALPDGSTRTITTEAVEELEVRLDVIVAGIVGALNGLVPDLVVVEDLPRNARGAGSTGPVHGAVRYWFYERGVPIARPSAATIKKYATGVGNCGKTAMALAAQKRADIDFGDHADECDAWWLRAAGLDAYGLPLIELPKAQRDALAKVDWPVLVDTALGGVA